MRWEQVKVAQEARVGIFHDVPELLPGLLFARKVQRRAASVGFEYDGVAAALADLESELRELADELAAAARARGRAARGSRARRRARRRPLRGRQRRAAHRRRSRARGPRGRRVASARASSAPRRSRPRTGAAFADARDRRAGAVLSGRQGPATRRRRCDRRRLADPALALDRRKRPHEHDRRRPRPPDPRLARQPHRRGRGASRERRHGPRRRAVRRVDRRARGGRAARRRRAPGAARASRRRSRT